MPDGPSGNGGDYDVQKCFEAGYTDQHSKQRSDVVRKNVVFNDRNSDDGFLHWRPISNLAVDS
jgi:hypothetical protein